MMARKRRRYWRNRKWITICTTALPRGFTEMSMDSFLQCFEDRERFRLRWLCHLDYYRGCDKWWNRSVEQIHRIAARFPSSVVFANRYNVGWEKACRRLLENVDTEHMIWVEDDYFWVKPFQLLDVMGKVWRERLWGCDIMYDEKAGLGAFTPSYWRLPPVEYLLKHWPKPFSELEAKRKLRRAGFRSYVEGRYDMELLRAIDIGRPWLMDRGDTETCVGQPLIVKRTERGTRKIWLSLVLYDHLYGTNLADRLEAEMRKNLEPRSSLMVGKKVDTLFRRDNFDWGPAFEKWRKA